MKQASFLVNAWPTGRDAWGGLNEYRHKTWCKCLRQAVSARRREGFDLTPDMQTKQQLSVNVTMHAGRNGASVSGDVKAYHDSIVTSLLDAYLTTSTVNVSSLKISAERKTGNAKKLGCTTVEITWKDL